MSSPLFDEVRYHDRRGKRLARDKAERRIATRFRPSARRKARGYRWNETGPKRSIFGETVQDTAGAVWTSLWRRGS